MRKQAQQFDQFASLRVRKPPLDHPEAVLANQQGRLTPEQLETLALMLEQRRFPHDTPRWLSILGSIYCLLTAIGVVGSASTVMHPTPLLPVFIFCLIATIPLLLVILIGSWITQRVKRKAKKRFQQNINSSVSSFEISSAQGEVTQMWQNTVKTSVGDLFLWKPLLPGLYHFYYIQDEYIVLSAQVVDRPAGHQGFEHVRQALQGRLCRALSFSMIDLQANQQGQLSEQQLRNIPRRIVQKRSIESIDGLLTIYTTDYDEDNQCYYEIDGGRSHKRFTVPCKALVAPLAGLHYRVYYLDINNLLSIEPLESPWWEPEGLS